MRSEAPRLCGAGTLARVRGVSRRPFRPNPPHGIQHSIRRVHPVQILGYLGTQKSARHRMLRITLNFRGPPILDCDQNPTRIGTVVRTSGMDDLLHDLRLYGGTTRCAVGNHVRTAASALRQMPSAISITLIVIGILITHQPSESRMESPEQLNEDLISRVRVLEMSKGDPRSRFDTFLPNPYP
jgi:hypothetical protein